MYNGGYNFIPDSQLNGYMYNYYPPLQQFPLYNGQYNYYPDYQQSLFTSQWQGPPQPVETQPFGFPSGVLSAQGAWGGQNIQNGMNSATADTSNVDANSEVWIEAKTSEGRLYYYNARRRESVWTKPENVKIFDQNQINAIDGAWVKCEANEGVYYYNKITCESTWDKPAAFDAAASNVANSNAVDVAVKSDKKENDGDKPATLSIVDGEVKSDEMKLQENKTSSGAEKELSEEVSSTVNEDMKETRVAKVIHINKSKWNVVWTNDKKVFFFDTETSRWTRPPELVGRADVDELVSCPPPEISPTKKTAESSKNSVDLKPRPVSYTSINGSKWEVIWTSDNRVFFFDSDSTASCFKRPPELVGRADVDELVSCPPPITPVSCTPINGTKWNVVWTNYNDVFFYNTDSKTSNEERPPELVGRADVDALVACPPHKRSRIPVFCTPINGTEWNVIWTNQNDVFFYNSDSKTSNWKRPPELVERADVDELVACPPPESSKIPVSCTPINGSDWNVVWTNHHDVFFYNSDSKTSTWKRPTELIGRADVDELVACPPPESFPTEETAEENDDFLPESKKIKLEV